MTHEHVQRGELAPRPRTPKYTHARVTTTSAETMVAADEEKKTVLYHIALSSDHDDLSTVTVKLGTTTVFVFHLPANGGAALLNLLGTEPSSEVNEAVTVTLSENGGLDVTLCYIQV